MITPLEFTMTAGGSATITDSSLAFVTVMLVNREGMNYNKTTGSVGNREFTHNSAGGSITFQNAAALEDEEVIVLIKP